MTDSTQGNESEALRSWKNALDQIYYHNAYRIPANYRPKSQTEKALQDSLKELELQCKERVDLLEALKQSRDDEAKEKAEALSNGAEGSKTPALLKKGPDTDKLQPVATSSSGTPGWLGGGTIAPIEYSSLAHPPTLPQRPSLSTASIPSVNDGSLRSKSYSNSKSSELLPLTQTQSSTSQKSRDPSPTKRGVGGMLKTLRSNSGKDAARSSSAASIRPSMRSKPPPGAANAATLAWGAPAPVKEAPKLSEAAEQLAAATARVSLQAKLPETVSPTSTKPLPPAKPEPLKYRSEYHVPNRIIDPHTRRIIPGALDSKGPNGPRTPPLSSPGIRRKKVGGDGPLRTEAVPPVLTDSGEDATTSSPEETRPRKKTARQKPPATDRLTPELTPSSDENDAEEDAEKTPDREWEEKCKRIMNRLPKGVDEAAAKQILNEIVIQGDEVHWSDIAGLEPAKSALKETVVYPFLRPDLFMGLREPARGMLLFGPPGTGKTMLARAVATESRSTFFAISASSLTSKFLGESEKLVRALFALAKALAPSIIFVDEIDSLLSSRSGASEHEATRRIKTEFLIQWSDLAKAAAGRESTSEKDKERGDASRVLVLAATNLPWAIDEAARRRFVRRQYIPLPEDHVREMQLKNLLSHQKQSLRPHDIRELVHLTEGFSGSDITALAKDAAMGPLRSLGEKLLSMRREEIRPIGFEDFEASLVNIRPSVSGKGLKEYEDWAREFGERGG